MPTTKKKTQSDDVATKATKKKSNVKNVVSSSPTKKTITNKTKSAKSPTSKGKSHIKNIEEEVINNIIK